MATNVANRSGRRGVTSKWCAELRQALALANREGGVYSVQARTPSNSIVKFVLLKQRDEHQQHPAPLATHPAPLATHNPFALLDASPSSPRCEGGLKRRLESLGDEDPDPLFDDYPNPAFGI